MEGHNKNFIYGLPKVTQIIFVDQDLQTLVVRIPRTFFAPHPHYRSIHHEGLCFEVYRLKEQAEIHSTVCTGILKFHPPKTFDQLTRLTAVLTYFAKRDQFTIRLIKDIFSKQLNRMANEVQKTTVPVVDLTTENAQDSHHQPCSSSGKGQYAGGFHPYRRTNKTERNGSHHHSAPNSNDQDIFSQNSSGKRENYSLRAFNKLHILNNISKNLRDYLPQYNNLDQSEQQMTNCPQMNDLNSGIVLNPSMNNYNLPGYSHQNTIPLVDTHSLTSKHMRSDNPVAHQNEFVNSSQASYQTQLRDTTSMETIGRIRAFQDHLSQQTQIPPSQMLNSNLSSLGALKQSKSRDLNQIRNVQHQNQITIQRPLNQPTLLPLNNQVMSSYLTQSSGTNQAQLSNGLFLQNLNIPQNNVVPYNMPYFASPLQGNTGLQKIVPTATINHYPSASLQDKAYVERNQSLMAPSTSSNYLAPNMYSDYRPGHLHPFKSHSHPYLPKSESHWPDAMLDPNQRLPQSQNHSMALPTNCNEEYESPSQNFSQFWPENGKWQIPSLPPMTSQAVQTIQTCCDSHASNNIMNIVVEPNIQECPINNLHSMPTNSLASFPSNLKSNIHDSNTQTAHAKPRWLTENISEETTNQRVYNIPRDSFTTVKPSQKIQFSDSLNTNTNSEAGINIQSSEIEQKPGCINRSQANPFDPCLVEQSSINTIIKSEPKDNFLSSVKTGITDRLQAKILDIGLIKGESTSCGKQHSSEENPIKQKSLNIENLPNKTDRSVETDKECCPPLITSDEDLDRDIINIINRKFNSPSSSSSGSPHGLVIDENALMHQL